MLIAIITGNYSQFDQFCDEYRIHKTSPLICHVPNIERTYGVEFDGVIKYGTWHTNEKAVEALEEIERQIDFRHTIRRQK